VVDVWEPRECRRDDRLRFLAMRTPPSSEFEDGWPRPAIDFFPRRLRLVVVVVQLWASTRATRFQFIYRVLASLSSRHSTDGPRRKAKPGITLVQLLVCKFQGFVAYLNIDGVQTLVVNPPMDPIPPTSARNRRNSRRRPPRSGLKVYVRAGTMGLGPDLSTGLIDVSEDGLCVRLTAPLAVRSEAEIVFEKIGSNRPIKVMAEVRWCVTDPDGASRAGLQFRHRLPYTQLVDFCKT
jgi:PilZ domain